MLVTTNTPFANIYHTTELVNHKLIITTFKAGYYPFEAEYYPIEAGYYPIEADVTFNIQTPN